MFGGCGGRVEWESDEGRGCNLRCGGEWMCVFEVGEEVERSRGWKWFFLFSRGEESWRWDRGGILEVW